MPILRSRVRVVRLAPSTLFIVPSCYGEFNVQLDCCRGCPVRTVCANKQSTETVVKEEVIGRLET